MDKQIRNGCSHDRKPSVYRKYVMHVAYCMYISTSTESIRKVQRLTFDPQFAHWQAAKPIPSPYAHTHPKSPVAGASFHSLDTEQCGEFHGFLTPGLVERLPFGGDDGMVQRAATRRSTPKQCPTFNTPPHPQQLFHTITLVLTLHSPPLLLSPLKPLPNNLVSTSS